MRGIWKWFRGLQGRWQAAITVGLLFVLAIIIGSASGGGGDKKSSAPKTSPSTTTAPQPPPPPPPAKPPPPPVPKQRPVVVLQGAGSRVLSVRLPVESPLVVRGTHSGQANFIVDLVGYGATSGAEENLFNEIGSYTGQTAVSDITSGRYRVRVQADGAWVLRFQQPVPTGLERHLLGVWRGHGARVIATQVDHKIQPIVTATHRGQANFIVDLIGYGDTSGELNLFNEIGNFHGQALAEESMPSGGYLLHVQADGNWTLRFTP